MTGYKKVKIDLIKWILLRFSAVTLLLGCLRSEQFNRFREGGLRAIEWLRDNRDHQGKHRPVAANVTLRVLNEVILASINSIYPNIRQLQAPLTCAALIFGPFTPRTNMCSSSRRIN